MSISIDHLQPHVHAAELPLEKLASNQQCTDSEKLTEVSRQFEAVLLRQILAEARKPMFRSQLPGSSTATDVYNDILNNQLADQISRSGSVGLASSLAGQLQHQLKTGDAAKISEKYG